MKKVLMTAGGPFIPIRQGSDRLIHDVAKYLNSLPDIELTLAIRGDPYAGFEADYAPICKRVVWIRNPRPWGLFGILNKIFARCGITVFDSLGMALGMRRRMTQLTRDFDVVLMNYVSWFAMLPAIVRHAKTICLTHDLMFYRRASLKGNATLRQRLCVAMTRFVELRLFRSFRKIAVLGEYERQMLHDLGYPIEHIVKIGMPIEARRGGPREKKYDFITVSGSAQVNVDGVMIFLNRIAPLLAPRKITYALAGPICKAGEIGKIGVGNRGTVESLSLIKLGYVDDLAEVCAESRVGVAIVPAGSGIKVKCVEVMLRGLPVITTDHGVEGIPATMEGHINIDHEDDETIKRRLLAWLDHPDEATRVGNIQAEQVRQAFSPETALLGLVEEIRK